MDYKKNLYNVSLGGQGFLLYNTPSKPARSLIQAPVFGNRFSSGDRDYTDLTFWWFWAQTDWANGIKDELSWKNDARYYYSTNIDAYSEYGTIKLASSLTLNKTFGDGGESKIKCGVYGRVGATSFHFIGTDKDSGGKPVVYRSSDGYTFTNISSSVMTSNQSLINYLVPVGNELLVGTEGIGNTNVVLTYLEDYTWTDRSAAVLSAMSGSSLGNSDSLATVSADIYLGVTSSSGNRVSLMKYSGGIWNELATWVDKTKIWDMINYLGNIYYLKGGLEDILELRIWNVSTNSDALIQRFRMSLDSVDYVHYGSLAGKLLHVLNGKLVITVPGDEIWEYNNSTLTRIWKENDARWDIGEEATGTILGGGVLHDYKIWWSNLMYDGNYFFNTKKDATESTTNYLIPIYTDGQYIRWFSKTNLLKLYSDSYWKGTANKNFLVFNQIDTISTIDKLFYSVNLVFKKLVADQKIVIEYSIDGMANWIELGNVSYANDGGAITSKILYFPENIIYKKISLRVKIESDGSNTPSLNDISMAYYPLPYYKQKWNLTLDCIDNLVLLDGKTQEPKRGEELRNILKMFWKNRNSLEFQDVDYATTAINDGSGLTATATTITVDSTADLPEQGIIRIEKEKIKYTGKTAVAFTGCTRHYDGTVATTHADDTIVSNSYNVILTNYQELTPVGVGAKINEFLVQVELLEI